MHQLNALNKSTSNDSIKNDQKENKPQLATASSFNANFTSADNEKSPLSISSHSSIQHNRQELFHQYGSTSLTDNTSKNEQSKQHQTVTFSSEINLANQARSSVLQVVQSGKPITKTIKTTTTDLNRPHLQLNFAHSFRHPIAGLSLDETGQNDNINPSQLSTVQITNRGSTFFSSKSPPNQQHHSILHQLSTSSYNQPTNIYQNPVNINQANQLTSPSYRTINLNTQSASGLTANDIYRGRNRCFKRSISLASASQSHHHLSLNQQMSLTQPFAGGHRRTLLGDYGRRRAYLDSFE